jgi:citrate synthase
MIQQVAEFVKTFLDSGPEVTIQYFSTLRKAHLMKNRIPERGLNDERHPGALLVEMIRTHTENVAFGTMSVYMRHLLRENPTLAAEALVHQTDDFISQEEKSGSTAFQAGYSLLLGHHVNTVESEILERMGMIQLHHGSAGANMVARYLATLHTGSVSDFLSASQMTLDGNRHFGAIHDMTHFMNELEPLTPEKRDKAIQDKVLSGGLPTFGHPEIAAAGRSDEIQQDPRPAIYLAPLFRAIDKGQITLTDKQREQLAIVQRIYQIAFVEGVVKPGREDDPPLRLTPNTDFGGWSVQEALGVYETDRTLLTYIFRGFGWMLDVREQLQQKIIRPVISPDPRIIPTPTADRTIPQVVVTVHNRLVQGDAFAAH